MRPSNRRRKPKDTQLHSSNRDRWLITYADMLTLLMTFFLVMYSMANVDKKKFNELSQSLASVFSGNVSVLQNPPGGILDKLPKPTEEKPKLLTPNTEKYSIPPTETEKSLKEAFDKVNKIINTKNLGANISATIEERGLSISFKEKLLFAVGSASISSDTEKSELLKSISDIIGSLPNFVRIEGFTDDTPIRNQYFDSNWELASQRAINMGKVLIANGIAPQRLSALSYGEYRPKKPNTSEENKQANRSIDIIILDSKYNKTEANSLKNTEKAAAN